MYVSHVVNLGEVYVQFSESEVELANITGLCAEAYDGETGDEYILENPQKV